jgi:hypothetical protein
MRLSSNLTVGHVFAKEREIDSDVDGSDWCDYEGNYYDKDESFQLHSIKAVFYK